MSICSNCFKDCSGSGPCPYCGYDARLDRGKYRCALPAGTVLGGKYIIGRVLGQGGFGITYIAQDYRDKKRVAVKEYYPESFAGRSGGLSVAPYSGDREEEFTYGKECFLSEAKTLAAFLGNPHIVQVYSYFEENDTAYFAMEYIEGVSLKQYLKDHGGRISYSEAYRLLLPIMDALSAVHAKGVIHRDISPDNLFITADGTAKLIDFGAARYSLGDRTHSLDVVLKHGYAPKEQYTRRGRQGPFSDVYAFAATFYRAITGKVPPDAVDRLEEDDLVLPSAMGCDIPPQAEDALMKALSVSAADRYQSIAAFRDALPVPEKGFTAPVTAQQMAARVRTEPARATASASAQTTMPSGSPANAPNLTTQNTTKKPIPPTTKTQHKDPIQNHPQPAQPIQSDASGAKKRKKPLAILLSGVAAVLVAVIVLLIVLLPKGGGEKLPVDPDSSKAADTTAAAKTELLTEAATESPTTFTKLDLTGSPSVSAAYYHTVGLKEDGTVAVTGYNRGGQCDVEGWTDIVAISANLFHTLGLKNDGTVVAAGSAYSAECDVANWSEIIAIDAGRWHSVGLKQDGTVVVTGDNSVGECNVSDWRDIIAVAAGETYTVGLKTDGTVVVTGVREYDHIDVSGWKNIVAISAHCDHIVGLKNDGTVVATGNNYHGQCDVEGWTDIVAISAGEAHTVGLKKDGTVVATKIHGILDDGPNYGQSDVQNWKDIVAISAGYNHTVGIKKNGTVVAVGDDDYSQCRVSDWNLK